MTQLYFNLKLLPPSVIGFLREGCTISDRAQSHSSPNNSAVLKVSLVVF